MTKLAKSIIHAAAALGALAVVPAAGAQVPGPERLEVVRTADGPRVLLAGIGSGTPYAEAAERLGGVGIINAFFGGTGPIFLQGEIDGLKCSMAAMTGDASRGEADRIQGIILTCEGGRLALWGLARRFRAALASLPVHEGSDRTWYGTFPSVASVDVEPAKEGSWWEEVFGPQELRVSIR